MSYLPLLIAGAVLACTGLCFYISNVLTHRKRKVAYNSFKTSKNSEYIRQRDNILWMIKHYQERQFEFVHLLETGVWSEDAFLLVQEHNDMAISMYQQELLALEANKLLNNIK